MTSLFEILKASKSLPADDGYTALLGRAAGGGKVPTEPKSWADVRKIVRAGKAAELLPLGTYYNVWGDDTSKAFELVAYDKHFDPSLTAQGYTHSITLCERDLTDIAQFDAIEAWLYLEQELPAGTYRFKLPNYDATYGGNKSYYFTFPVATPAGGQLVFTWNYQQMPSKMASYASNTSTTALNNVNLAEWIEGESPDAVNLGICKLAVSDPDSSYGKINHVHRARYGSNNYYQSGIRQFLNSDFAGGTWWQPTTIFDRPYGQRSSAGKLTQLSSDLRSVLATPEIEYITCNDFEFGSIGDIPFKLQTPYTIAEDKIFLLSHTEVNLSSAPNVGTVLDTYIGAGNEDRIKKRTSNNSAYTWWLRTPYPSNASTERSVLTSGALNGSLASHADGAPAACIIQ
ncbi:DUF6273 domain-containing protein [Ruminococcus flavefaciens]|uniref:DUF6273 domain-containing protein n=1 Tax=Ruminococcus flavefaciens TaxID=1265 RepID=UPI0002DA9B82|nr:DUF6273 domain-containing protein [Ruminococcus flavefaciens]